MVENQLAIVTSRFWPLMGSTGAFAAYVAVALRESEQQPIIVTPAWHADWPSRLDYQEVPVIRLARASGRFWGRQRFARSLGKWLQEHQHALAGVVVAALDPETFQTLDAIFAAVERVWIRVSESGLRDLESDLLRWLDSSPERSRKESVTWLADTPDVAARLRGSGIPGESVIVMSPGVPSRPKRSAVERYESRAALAEANYDLAAAEFAPVLVTVGDLEEERGLVELVEMFRDVATACPSARLWLIGDGPARSSLYHQAIDLEIQHQVRLPGTFDNVWGVLAAADIYLSPSAFASTNLAVLEAMAAGVPVIAADSATHRHYLDDGRCGILTAPGDPCMWTRQIQHLLDHPASASELGEAARQHAISTFSIERYVSRIMADL